MRQTHTLARIGIGRTLSRLQLTWYWPGMTAEVRRVVRSFEVCQAAKHGQIRGPSNRQRLYARQPWQKVAVDLVGPLPETEKGIRWILLLTDRFNRWQDALAIPAANAPVVAAILDDRIFCYMGTV